MKHTTLSLVYILILSQTTFSQTIPSYIPTDSLVAWYPFNGNANDESGNGNNGTVNGASLTSDKNRNENSAYSFDGNDDFIEINLPAFNSELSISIWVNPTSFSSGASPRLLTTSEGSGGGTNRWFLTMTPESENNVIQFGSGKGTTEATSGNTSLKKDEWVYVTMTFKNGEVSIFMNGVLDNKTTFNEKKLSHVVASTKIGSANGNSFFNGQIDDIAIWNRTLTEAEILAAYKQSADNPSSLSSRTLQVDSTYTKKGFKFSNYISLDTLATSDSLISYEFDLHIPDGVTYDSLSVFHLESNPSVTSNFEDSTLKVVVTGSGFITKYNPLLEVFYTSNTIGTFPLEPFNAILNTTSISRINGVMKIDPFVKGDVDDSGVIQAYDASIILHQNVGSEILKPDPVKDWENGPWFNWRDSAADVDGDGKVIALDASYISQLIAGLITEFPTSTPSVESVIIEVTERGLKIIAPENIQSLNIEIPATEQIEFRDPEMSWNNSSVAMNKAEGMKVAVASSGQVSGEVMEIPLYVYTNDNITLEVTTVTNNTKKVHQVVVSGLTVNNEVTSVLPQQYTLSQNYPNPFNPSTQIQYALPEATQVTLEVFNSVGQKVMELVNGQKSAGLHTATFDASGLSSGVYLYKLTTPSFTQTKKMLLIK